jgi:hypothetical protein
MSKLIDIVREQRRRRAGINDSLKLFHWADFDPGRRSHALGLQQNVDEPHEDFMGRVEATAQTKGVRVAFIDNVRGAGLTVIQAPLGS